MGKIIIGEEYYVIQREWLKGAKLYPTPKRVAEKICSGLYKCDGVLSPVYEMFLFKDKAAALKQARYLNHIIARDAVKKMKKYNNELARIYKETQSKNLSSDTAKAATENG